MYGYRSPHAVVRSLNPLSGPGCPAMSGTGRTLTTPALLDIGASLGCRGHIGDALRTTLPLQRFGRREIPADAPPAPGLRDPQGPALHDWPWLHCAVRAIDSTRNLPFSLSRAGCVRVGMVQGSS